MSDKFELKKDFQRILNKWEKVLEQESTELVRDAAILRFELAYEVAWKLIKAEAKEEGLLVNSPRQAFTTAFKMGWISDEVVWSDIIDNRNKTTHIYHEELAQSVYEQLPEFLEAFRELEGNLVKE